MNKMTRPGEMQTPEVTTGPIIGSQKVYSSPEGHPDIRVPFREIALHETSGEPPFRVYDPSGPYTETDVKVNVEAGLPRIREAWIKDRGNVEAYDGREVKPEDNGNVTGKHLARDFPNKPQPLRAASTDQPITQLGIRPRRYRHQRNGVHRPPREHRAHGTTGPRESRNR